MISRCETEASPQQRCPARFIESTSRLDEPVRLGPAVLTNQTEAVPLGTVMEVVGVKQTAAGDIRRAAAAQLEGGYRPTELETALDVAWDSWS
ncbi:hypothetical protein [Streptomyces sp. NPDC057686]|uniref:hypothetical protein n=1 Tax=Streptomyces sp. NPDC057686 TaxID=3346212 RepID=UPI0036A4C289